MRSGVKKILDLLTEKMGQAFEAAGYDAALGRSETVQESAHYDCQ
jgi:hypothetical protein